MIGIGLRWRDKGKKPYSNFFNRVFQDFDIKIEKKVTFFLKRRSKGSKIIFGDIGEEIQSKYNFFSNVLNYPEIEKKKKFWMMKMDDILINGKSVGLCPKGKECYAVVDTGTSVLMGPKEKIKKLRSKNYSL